MNLKNTMIVCLAILAALLAGLFFGEQTGEKVAAAKLEPQVTSLTTERDRQDRYIASLTDAINFFQDSFSYTTTASWYGSFEQGRPTASGERFDMEGMTAAAPYLPLDTWWTVTDVKSRRSVVVRINDRGPWVIGRGIDLSKAAARALGFEKAGLARVIMTPKIGKED